MTSKCVAGNRVGLHHSPIRGGSDSRPLANQKLMAAQKFSAGSNPLSWARQDLQGREAQRSSRRAADQVRTGHKSQNRRVARPHRTTIPARPPTRSSNEDQSAGRTIDRRREILSLLGTTV